MSNTALGSILLAVMAALLSALLALFFGLGWWPAFLIYTCIGNVGFWVFLAAVALRSVWLNEPDQSAKPSLQ